MVAEQSVINVLAGILVVGFPTFCIALFMMKTDGPLDVFINIRMFAHTLNNDGSYKYKFLQGLLSCVWCLSTWIAFVIALYFVLLTHLWFAFPLIWLGSVPVSGLLYKIVVTGE